MATRRSCAFFGGTASAVPLFCFMGGREYARDNIHCNKEGDAELIKQIVQYQKQNFFAHDSDVDGTLCKDALAFKKLVER